MKKQTTFLKGIFMSFCLGICAFLWVSCSEENTEPTPDTEPDVELSTNAQFGQILVDGQGRTLYFFTEDPKTTSNCTGGCLDVWPVFYEENLLTGTGLSAADFGEITRTDGQKQTTYKGWPLYYYSPTGNGTIEAAGQIQGDNVGSVWFVAKPDYDILLARQSVGGSEVQYLVDLEGNTLYYFKNDSSNISNCDGSCESTWPIFKVDVSKMPSSLSADDFGTFTRTDGQTQTTYRGWPLYYFNNDTQRGDVNGHNVGGVWFVTDEDAAPAPTPYEVSPDVEISDNATYGNILVDAEGRTLYFFTKDPQGTSNCSGGCLDVWPIFYAENLEAGEGLNTVDFGEITRAGGVKQSTYMGWPLYYYSPTSNGVIENAGQTQGEGFGSVWYVAKPDYDLMLANQSIGGSDVQYLVDLSGRTLYYFTNDSNNTSSCSGGCANTWPVFELDPEKIPSSLTASDFGQITRTDGKKQATYKGWPLYYYNSDTDRGQINGHTIGGVWFVMNKNTAQAPN